MLRELQVIGNKNVDAMYKAGAAMETGMGVVKSFADKTVDFPAAAASTNIFFVEKERVPTGLNAAKKDMSDYDDNFVKIAEGEMVELIAPVTGERYAVEAYVKTELSEGDFLEVGTDGKWKKAAAATKFIYGGEYADNGHTLAIIEIGDIAAAAAAAEGGK